MIKRYGTKRYEIKRYVAAIYDTCLTRALATCLHTTITVSVWLIYSSTLLSAQDKTGPFRYEISHRVPEISAVPMAGALMPISVELINTREVEAKVRLVGSRDGRFMDIAFPIGALNKLDQPTYMLEVPAPLAAMTYQFIIHQPDGSLSTSAKYAIKRPCIQNFRVAVAKNDPNAKIKIILATLISRSKTLERENTNLETSLKILENFSANINH